MYLSLTHYCRNYDTIYIIMTLTDSPQCIRKYARLKINVWQNISVHSLSPVTLMRSRRTVSFPRPFELHFAVQFLFVSLTVKYSIYSRHWKFVLHNVGSSERFTQFPGTVLMSYIWKKVYFCAILSRWWIIFARK